MQEPLLLSHISCVQLCATPQTAAHQAPPSLGFSRQEHWSGLPFPSPMHESEKWKWSRSVVSDPQRPHGPQPSRLLHPCDFPGKSTGVGGHCLLQQCRRHRFNPWVRRPRDRDPETQVQSQGLLTWRRTWLTTSVFLPREFHGQSSLEGYSPWGYKESDLTE